MRGLKIILVTIAALAFALCLGNTADANDIDVTLQVTMKTANSITAKLIEIESVKDSDDIWGVATDVSGTALINFTKPGRTLTKTTDGVYLTGYYYALEISPVGGGWTGTGVDLTYFDGDPDIASHATMTVVRAEYTGPDTDPNEIKLHEKVKLQTIPINTADLVGGWLRIYLGLSTGESDPAGVTPLTDGTAAGTYSGTLRISYTGS